jgi:hypothetical protein
MEHIVLFGNEITLKQIFEKTKLRYFHFERIKYYYAAKTLNIKDWGRHKILAIKTEYDDELKYYFTNKLNMKPENIWKNYQNRKWIEAFYQDAKEIIGLNKFYMHAKNSVISYFNFIWYLYDILAIYKAEKAENGINISIFKSIPPGQGTQRPFVQVAVEVICCYYGHARFFPHGF